MIVHHDRWVLRAFSGDRVVLVGWLSRLFFCPVVLVRKTLRVSSWIPIMPAEVRSFFTKMRGAASKLGQGSNFSPNAAQGDYPLVQLELFNQSSTQRRTKKASINNGR